MSVLFWIGLCLLVSLLVALVAGYALRRLGETPPVPGAVNPDDAEQPERSEQPRAHP